MSIDLDSLEPPHLHLVVAEQKVFSAYAFRTSFRETQLAIRVVRGKKMKRREDCFNEFSAAFQFPDYFGENWDALEECLYDLEWLPAKGYVVFVLNTGDVLKEEPSRQFEIFTEVLSEVASQWSRAENPKPFHVLLQTTETELATLWERSKSLTLSKADIAVIPED